MTRRRPLAYTESGPAGFINQGVRGIMDGINTPPKREWGQSLVEVALFMPIILIVIAGVVEVSNLLLSSSRVEAAARNAARFGAEGGIDDGMRISALNTVTQTLSMDPATWDMWTIRGKVNSAGTGLSEWSFAHVYGQQQTKFYSGVAASDAEIRQEVLDHLRQAELGGSNQAAAANIEFVGMFVVHDVPSILGLDTYIQGMNSVRGFNVMRLASAPTADATAGCHAYPLIVEEGIRSLGSTGYPFPPPNQFQYPTGNDIPTLANFPYNVPDVPFTQAKPGYVYKILNGQGSGNFGWLSWNTYINEGNGSTLAEAMAYPGMDSIDYGDHNDGGQRPPGYSHVVRGFLQVGIPADARLTVGDRVAAGPGSPNSNALRTALNDHINKKRTLRVLVWRYENGGYNNGGQGNNGWYRITGFALMKIHGYRLNQGGGQGGGSWILAEFVSLDESCGQSP